MFNINSFQNNLSTYGYNKANRYSVTIYGAGNANLRYSLEFRLQSFSLPGKQISTSDVIDGTGPIKKVPYTTTYEDLVLTLLLDKKLSQRTLISQWMGKIIPSHESEGSVGSIQMYSDFANATINVATYSESTGYIAPTNVVTFHKAYPIGIGNISYGYANDTPATIDVSFAYEYWTTE
jgi:hypothetical protein